MAQFTRQSSKNEPKIAFLRIDSLPEENRSLDVHFKFNALNLQCY